MVRYGMVDGSDGYGATQLAFPIFSILHLWPAFFFCFFQVFRFDHLRYELGVERGGEGRGGEGVGLVQPVSSIIREFRKRETNLRVQRYLLIIGICIPVEE